MPIRLIPVNHIPAIIGIDLHIHGPAHKTAIRDVGSLDTPQYFIKLLLVDPKAKVIDREIFISLDKIQRQALIHEHRRKWHQSRWRPGHTQQIANRFAEASLSCEGTIV